MLPPDPDDLRTEIHETRRVDSPAHRLMDFGRSWEAMCIDAGIVPSRASDVQFLSDSELRVLMVARGDQ